MIIIGEKINSFLPGVADAIASRDRETIRALAKDQARWGADYLELCAGANPAGEREDLAWLLEVVQEAVDTPVCIDSADAGVILDTLPLAKRPGIVNSITGEAEKYDILLSAIGDTDWKVIALACDGRTIAMETEARVSVASRIVETAGRFGVKGERLLIDPMVMALSATPDAAERFTETARRVRALFPEVGIACGVSNISYGMPCREAVNAQFLALAAQAGADCLILDPTVAAIRTALWATQALLGQDRGGRAFLRAYRKGIFHWEEQA